LSRSAGNDDRDALKVGELFALSDDVRMTTPSQARSAGPSVLSTVPPNAKV
jgi:hypothetical protein